MPEQAEWTSDSCDYTWRPEYVRQAVRGLRAEYPSGKPLVPPYSAANYDTRTLGERVEALEKFVADLKNQQGEL